MIGRNESWLKEPKGLVFSYPIAKQVVAKTGCDLVTQGGVVVQTAACLEPIAFSMIEPAWQDEFLYQAVKEDTYTLSFTFKGALKWVDQQKEISDRSCYQVVIEPGNTAHLIQDLQGTGLRVLNIVLQKDSQLKHEVYLSAGEYDYINVVVESGAYYEQVYALSGHGRRATRVLLVGKDAKANLSGAIVTQKESAMKEHVLIEHMGEHTHSHHLVKTINHGKVAVYSAVNVHSTARLSESKQDLQHLLLSEHSGAFSKPALDIAIDEVSCEHGALTGMMDETLLFYMLSRGLDKEQAKLLYIKGFVESAYAEYPELESKMAEFIQRSL